MTVTDLSCIDAMNSVKGARKATKPNFGFQRQLQNYEHTKVKTVSCLFRVGFLMTDLFLLRFFCMDLIFMLEICLR